MQSTSRTLQSLPPEIHLEIIDFVDADRRPQINLLSLAAVSRSWRTLCRPIIFACLSIEARSNLSTHYYISEALPIVGCFVKKLSITPFITNAFSIDQPHLRRRLGNHSINVTLAWEAERDSLFHMLLRLLPNVRSMELIGYCDTFPRMAGRVERLLKMSNEAPNLRTMHLEGVTISMLSVIHLPPFINSLRVKLLRSLHQDESISINWWRAVLFSNLNILELANFPALAQDAIQLFLRSTQGNRAATPCTPLRRLSLQHFDLDLESFYAILHVFGSTLQDCELSVNYSTPLSPTLLNPKAIPCPQLRSLVIEEIETNFRTLVQLFAHPHTPLRALSIHGQWKRSDVEYLIDTNLFANLKHVRYLAYIESHLGDWDDDVPEGWPGAADWTAEDAAYAKELCFVRSCRFLLDVERVTEVHEGESEEEGYTTDGSGGMGHLSSDEED